MELVQPIGYGLWGLGWGLSGACTANRVWAMGLGWGLRWGLSGACTANRVWAVGVRWSLYRQYGMGCGG